MEEVSFRAGAAVAGGVLTAAGVAIALAVVPSGHRDAAAIAPARIVAPSLAPPPVAPVSSVPSPTPRPSRTTTRATAAGTYQREARSPHRPGMWPSYWSSRRPRTWLFGLLWHHRRR